jgi:hypothetical protein
MLDDEVTRIFWQRSGLTFCSRIGQTGSLLSIAAKAVPRCAISLARK